MYCKDEIVRNRYHECIITFIVNEHSFNFLDCSCSVNYRFADCLLFLLQYEGTERMIKFVQYIRKGAMAYLKQQYKVIAIVFVVLALFFAYLAYVAKVQNL